MECARSFVLLTDTNGLPMILENNLDGYADDSTLLVEVSKLCNRV